MSVTFLFPVAKLNQVDVLLSPKKKVLNPIGDKRAQSKSFDRKDGLFEYTQQ